MTDAFCDVQRIVLSGGPWQVSQQLAIGGAEASPLLHFLNCLLKAHCPTSAGERQPTVQISLGFSRRGLARARVPAHVLAALAAKAPAFVAGAAPRAASRVGSCGPDAPAHWDQAFDFNALDTVLSLHAAAHGELDGAMAAIQALATASALRVTALPRAEWPARADGHRCVHFGFRDDLSRVGIEGWSDDRYLAQCKPSSRHAAGEFLLGHPQNSRANPWLASGGRTVWPEELRAFFHNGSFGVLQQIEQYVSVFEAFVADAANDSKLDSETIRAKLCGRTSEGRPVGLGRGADAEADFDYKGDEKGEGCPFGAHARRMNPRDGELAHARRRPLLRRGMPYGPAKPGDNESCGLMGMFFCASIEDQFEHLLGQWAERVPLGSGDRGGARDPFIGAHEPGDGPFHIPVPDRAPIELDGLRRFTRTRGTAYLFYPSVTVLHCIARNEVFADLREPEA